MNPKPESTAVTKPKPILPADIQATIEANRTRNAAVAAIRGTMWGKSISAEAVRAVAQYCHENGLDPVRHVEILGGKPYLTAEYYMEKLAPYVRQGILIPHETDFIQADPRLEALAKQGGERGAWATEESNRRLMERIKRGVPDNATAAAVARYTVAATGEVIEGTNWCGGGSRKNDPVGDAEPTKTAETRAIRRAGRKVVSVIPEAEAEVREIEARAQIVSDELLEIHQAEPKQLPRPTMLAGQDEEREPVAKVDLAPLNGDFFGEEDAA